MYICIFYIYRRIPYKYYFSMLHICHVYLFWVSLIANKSESKINLIRKCILKFHLQDVSEQFFKTFRKIMQNFTNCFQIIRK